MSEHQHPGVYIEEIGMGPKPIEGVPTNTAAFLGETERGPLIPQLVTSYADYERTFGGVFGTGKYLPHAIDGFFENGGKRAVVCRIEAAGASIDYQTGLTALEDDAWRDVSLVYAPNASSDVAKAIVAHCQKMRYRFAVIDCPEGQSDATQLDPRRSIAVSSYAAFYYPWIFTAEPGSGARVLTPPGGHVMGIYARTDTERGVFKTPANEVVRGALDVEFSLAPDVQNALPLKSVNLIRTFPGRGIRVWGGRTMESDAEWKYINVRRFVMYLEHSIDHGLQWTVFEPNGDRLWARVVDSIRNFLRVQWRAGALQGQKEQEAFFIKCDRTTMTQDDILNGRLICEVGIATMRPAEFVIIRLKKTTSQPSDLPS